MRISIILLSLFLTDGYYKSLSTQHVSTSNFHFMVGLSTPVLDNRKVEMYVKLIAMCVVSGIQSSVLCTENKAGFLQHVFYWTIIYVSGTIEWF